MKSEFSERQYETAVNYELTLGLDAFLVPPFPIVPSLAEEARVGWDAMFELGSNYWYFLQYKVVHHGTRRTAWNAHYWDTHRGEYFRFDLLATRRGFLRQHRRLSILRRTQPGVYYCAPYFGSETSLWRFARERNVFWNSALIDLADVDLPDHTNPHRISFDRTGQVQVWSEPTEGSKSDRSGELRRSTENLRTSNGDELAALVVDAAAAATADEPDRHLSGSTSAQLIADRLEAAAREQMGDLTEVEDRDDILAVLSDGLSTTELALTAARILAIDLQLAFFVEPADSGT